MICENVRVQISEAGAMYEHPCADCGCALILHNRQTGSCCLHTAVEQLAAPVVPK